MVAESYLEFLMPTPTPTPTAIATSDNKTTIATMNCIQPLLWSACCLNGLFANHCFSFVAPSLVTAIGGSNSSLNDALSGHRCLRCSYSQTYGGGCGVPTRLPSSNNGGRTSTEGRLLLRLECDIVEEIWKNHQCNAELKRDRLQHMVLSYSNTRTSCP